MIKRLTPWLILIYVSINLVLCQEASNTFSITPDNTTIEFRAKHFGIINVTGTFKSFSGQITISNDIVTSGKISLNVSSINTANTSRDRSLKDKEFLDAEGHPFITVSFNNNYKTDLISSLVKVKGTSISIPILYQLSPAIQVVRNVQANCTISRKQFNLDFGSMDDLISDKIDIDVFVTLKVK